MALLATYAAVAFAGLANGYAQIDAGFVMRKNIDPLVVPGQYNSHMHSFFGSDAVTVNTTTSAELQSGCHSNSNPNDFSVYWVPTLYAVKGEERIPIEPRYFKAYYEGINEAEIAIPQDFSAIAGNAKAKSQADVSEFTTISWWCEYGPDGAAKDEAAFPTETCNVGRLQVILRFPDCVNTETLESDYSGRHHLPRVNRCPEGMLRIPKVRFSVRYAVDEAVPEGWSGEATFELASGPSYSFHGDFMNAWLPEAAENMLLASDKREFQVVDGPLSEQPECTLQDADPSNGTDDYEESLLSLGEGSSDDDESAPSQTAVAETPTTTSAASVVEPIPTTLITATTSAAGGDEPVSTPTPTPSAPTDPACPARKLRRRRSHRHAGRRA